MTLEIRTHQTRTDVEALAADWDALVIAAPRPSPYLLNAWCDEWLYAHGTGASVTAVTAHRDGRLVGLLPACIVRRHGLRMLTFIGESESWLADILLAPGEPEATAQALIAEARRAPFDLAVLSGVPGDSLLAASAPDLRLVERVESPVLDMPDGWEAAYASTTSSQRRSRDRKRERQLAAAGAFEIVFADSPEQIDGVFDDVLAVHALRWAGRRDGSDFGTPDGARTQRAAFRRLSMDGHAGIVLLVLDGRPIGFQLWLAIGDTMYLHRSGVDPALMKFSPGLIAMRHAIAHGSDELGIRRVEMLGAGEQYKLDLATRLMPTHDAYGLSQTLVGAAAVSSLVGAVHARRRLREVELLRRIYLEGPRALRRRSATPAR